MGACCRKLQTHRRPGEVERLDRHGRAEPVRRGYDAAAVADHSGVERELGRAEVGLPTTAAVADAADLTTGVG